MVYAMLPLFSCFDESTQKTGFSAKIEQKGIRNAVLLLVIIIFVDLHWCHMFVSQSLKAMVFILARWHLICHALYASLQQTRP